ncbi:MAG TPA: hypothetical protein VHZ02_09305, partial [Acidimicrobiales bacterium]|nr:hypothetical protein [Acidimicrobiales bacterium]
PSHPGWYENGRCTGSEASRYIGSDVTDDGTSGRRDPKRCGRFQQEAGRRLAAGTTTVRLVGAYLPDVEPSQELINVSIDSIHLFPGEVAPGDAALIGDHAQSDPSPAQPGDRLPGSRLQPNPLGVAVIGHIDHERAITVEKDRTQVPNHVKPVQNLKSRINQLFGHPLTHE